MRVITQTVENGTIETARFGRYEIRDANGNEYRAIVISNEFGGYPCENVDEFEDALGISIDELHMQLADDVWMSIYPA